MQHALAGQGEAASAWVFGHFFFLLSICVCLIRSHVAAGASAALSLATSPFCHRRHSESLLEKGQGRKTPHSSFSSSSVGQSLSRWGGNAS